MKNIPVIIASNPDYRQTVHLRRNAQNPVFIRPAAAYLQPGPVLRYKVGDSVVGEFFARFVLRITAGLSAVSGIAAGRAVRGRTRSARQDHAPPCKPRYAASISSRTGDSDTFISQPMKNTAAARTAKRQRFPAKAGRENIFFTIRWYTRFRLV